MEKSLSLKIATRIKKLNEWQRTIGKISGMIITFQTKKDKDGNYSLLRTYSDGTRQISNKKSPEEIVPFLDRFCKHYNIC